MAKDPAVLFYTSDFLTGTMLMSLEQRGKYITLLCLQHQKGMLSEQDMIKICSSYDKEVFDKFIKTAEGFYNKRMKDEHERRSNFSKSRSENRLKGLENKKLTSKKKTKTSYDNHMENENTNESININKKIEVMDKVFLTEDQIHKLGSEFGANYDTAIKTLSNYKNSSGKKYKSDYHALIGWVKEKLKTQNNGTVTSSISKY